MFVLKVSLIIFLLQSDLYSLGIVLYELMQPFKTDMERSKMVGQLRVENIPPELCITAPKWVSNLHI